MATEVKFEIKETIISVNDGDAKWNLELNLVSWNGREPKYDLRKWSSDHSKMGKGVSMSEDEAILLFQRAEDFLKKFRTEPVAKPLDVVWSEGSAASAPIVQEPASDEDEPLPFD